MIVGPRAAGAEGSGRSLVVSIVREVEVLRFRLSLGDWVVDHRFRHARPCGDGGRERGLSEEFNSKMLR